MPKEIKDVRDFMNLFQAPVKKEKKKRERKPSKQKEVKEQKAKPEVHRPKNTFKKRLLIKHNKKITKFKLRTRRTLYTFKTDNQETAKRILANVPTNIEREEIKKKKIIKKKK